MAFLSFKKRSPKLLRLPCFFFGFNRDSDVHLTESLTKQQTPFHQGHNLKHYTIMGFKLCMGRKVED